MSKQNRATNRAANRRTLVWISVGVVVVIGMCSLVTISGARGLINFVNSFSLGEGPVAVESNQTWAPDSAELTVAVSPVMAPVLEELAGSFNDQRSTTPDGQRMSVRVMPYEPERMVAAALNQPPFQAMSPDSSLWLDRLEQGWSAQSEAESDTQIPIGQRRVADQVRYAVSPIVIAAWEEVARDLGWPDRAVGWEDIQRQATEDANFKWNHPSTNNAAGLLATLAEFYAGAGLTRGLTEEAATAPETLEYVRNVEATVRFYGEGEEVIVERLAEEGRNFLDAFVAQERVVIDWNRAGRGDRLVAIYPAEGTLWTDHPMALLNLGTVPGELAVTDNQRLTYQALTAYLNSAEVQKLLLDAGYRPADLSISLDQEGSPFAGATAVDWREPQTTLQMPSPAVVDVVQNFWYYTKRPTNVYLVVDTSGSMAGDKLERTKEALAAFVGEIKGDRDRIGIVEFGTSVKSFTELTPVDDSNRRQMVTLIDMLDAGGDTALIDAVYEATAYLVGLNDAEAINALVVMTDGQENQSWRDLNDLQNLLRATPGAKPVIFTIAFGVDADEGLLQSMATVGNGQFRRADETDITELYQIISTYF